VMDWQKTLEGLHRLATSFNRMSLVILGRHTKGWSIAAYSLAKSVYRLNKLGGPAFCSAYLKVSNTAFLNYLSKDLSVSKLDKQMYSPRCSLTRQGIPRIILPKHRKILRSGGPESVVVARWYLSLFGFYRTFTNLRKRPDLSPIWRKGGIIRMTGKESQYLTPNLCRGKHGVQEDLMIWMTTMFPRLVSGLMKKFPSEITLGFQWLPSWSGGPNTRKTASGTSVEVLRHDIAHWNHEVTKVLPPGEENEDRERWVYLVSTYLYPYRIRNIPVTDSRLEPSFDFVKLITELAEPEEGKWGKLGLKHEGGGKVRVFAMLDSIRQALLRPIHNWLMSVLRSIPNDGTFDQLKPLYALRKKKIKKLYSFDLTSATDRFPIFLQTRMLEGFLGPPITCAWQQILKFPFSASFARKLPPIRFRMGQPLGAYSSWPAFALTHHAFVQYCARKAGFPGNRWFRDYAILGDDIIIAHEGAARVYKDLISLQGVAMSHHKTIISDNGSCEFAKRFLWKGIDISPISFKEVYSMRRSTSLSLVKRLRTFRAVHRKEPFRWFGASHRVLPKFLKPDKGRWKRFHLMLTSPSGPFPLPFIWWCSQYTSRPLDERVTARVHQELLDKWQFSFEPEGIPSDREDGIVEDVLMGRPWIRSWLTVSTPFLLALMGENPITAWFHRPTVPSTPERPRVERSLRMGKVYWIYDRMVAVSKLPTLKSLGK